MTPRSGSRTSARPPGETRASSEKDRPIANRNGDECGMDRNAFAFVALAVAFGLLLDRVFAALGDATVNAVVSAFREDDFLPLILASFSVGPRGRLLRSDRRRPDRTRARCCHSADPLAVLRQTLVVVGTVWRNGPTRLRSGHHQTADSLLGSGDGRSARRRDDCRPPLGGHQRRSRCICRGDEHRRCRGNRASSDRARRGTSSPAELAACAASGLGRIARIRTWLGIGNKP
jgi:hypothetical protein